MSEGQLTTGAASCSLAGLSVQAETGLSDLPPSVLALVISPLLEDDLRCSCRLAAVNRAFNAALKQASVGRPRLVRPPYYRVHCVLYWIY